MNRFLEQRYAVKFCFKVGNTASETYKMIQSVYKNDAMGRSSVYEWHKLFREGREQVEDDQRSGRLSTITNDVNLARVNNLLNSDRRLNVRMISEMLNLPKTSVHKMVTENLGMRKVCEKRKEQSVEDVATTSNQVPSTSAASNQQTLFLLPPGQSPMNVQQAVWISVPTVQSGGAATSADAPSTSNYQIPIAMNTNAETSTTTTTAKSKKKRKLEGSLDANGTSTDHQEDGVDAMARVWAARFKKLSSEQRNYAKQIIDAVLTEAEMGLLTLDDVTAAATTTEAGVPAKERAQEESDPEVVSTSLDISYSDSGPADIDIEFSAIVPKSEPEPDHSEIVPETDPIDTPTGSILHGALVTGSEPGESHDRSVFVDTESSYSGTVVKLEPVDVEPSELIVPEMLALDKVESQQRNLVMITNYLERSKESSEGPKKKPPKDRTKGSSSAGLQSNNPVSDDSLVMEIKAEDEDFGK